MSIDLTPDQVKVALTEQKEHLDGPNLGIAKKVLSSGEDSLSKSQEAKFKKNIQPSLQEKCGNPHCKSSALAGETYCSSCEIEFGK